MPLPLIGLTTSVLTGRGPERAALNAAYIAAVQGAGAVPVLLPPHLDAPARDALWARLDGLVLTGGGDVDPARFGEASHPTVADVSAARDALELDLARRAVEEGLPLLAICRGIQVLNVALGGTLWQDVPSQVPGALAHNQTAPRHEPTHRVKLLGEGTLLYAASGARELAVNSFHHQAVKRLGGGLREVAWAEDGLIEGVELPEHPFAVGVQWHPEDLVEHDPAARGLFAALVEAIGAARARSRRR
jgi:putative glutamine amidotransferase